MIRQEVPEMLMDSVENLLTDRNLSVREIQPCKGKPDKGRHKKKVF
jgi:hypothetical protein